MNLIYDKTAIFHLFAVNTHCIEKSIKIYIFQKYAGIYVIVLLTSFTFNGQCLLHCLTHSKRCLTHSNLICSTDPFLI